MSYSLMPYAVDSRRLLAALGSRDDVVLEQCSARFDEARIDEMIETTLGPDAESRPTGRDLLRHMVFGEPYDARLGFAYGYVLVQLCERFGRFLDNTAWSMIRLEFFDQVQSALASAGVSPDAFKTARLTSAPPPVALPRIDDFPLIGWLAEDEVSAARKVLASANLDAIADAYEREAAEALRDWLAFCADQARALVCFYY